MEGIQGGRGWNTVVAASHPMDDEAADLRRGPWTVEEDLALINFISINGEGRWNSLARSAGLKRTGKSCRLRWLNYLRPDVRRGNITPEEQLLILELHSRWGNRWSKIAQHLPGRTDNEIKNYWRTRVQKHAKQLQCDVNSKQFKDVMRYLWMPRLLERIQAAAAASSASSSPLDTINNPNIIAQQQQPSPQVLVSADTTDLHHQQQQQKTTTSCMISPDNSSMGCCSNLTSDSMTTQLMMITSTPPQTQAVPDCYGSVFLSEADHRTTASETNNHPCEYYNFNSNQQDLYFAPAPVPEFDRDQDYLWSMDYDDQILWPLQQL